MTVFYIQSSGIIRIQVKLYTFHLLHYITIIELHLKNLYFSIESLDKVLMF